MKLQYKKALVFILAGVVYLAGQYLRGTWFVSTSLQNFCRPIIENGTTYCNSPYLNEGIVLIDLGQMLAIIAVILFFVSATTFNRWFKFSLFYVPIVVILDLLIYPISFSPLSQPLSHAQGVYPFGWLYVVITLGIALSGLFKSPHKLQG